LPLGQIKIQRTGENNKIMHFIICDIHVMLLKELNKEGGMELIEVPYCASVNTVINFSTPCTGRKYLVEKF
jgi:hypothetical protein